MADVGRLEDGRGQPADSDRDASAGHFVEERGGRLDFVSRGPPVRGLTTGMRRDDVPEESTSSSTPSSASTRWTIVAAASAGPEPVSWRSEVKGIPLTRAPR